MADTLHNIAPFRPPARGEMIPAANGVYFMGDYIGGGAFGDVFECTDEWSNPLVAKVLRPARTFDEMYQHAFYLIIEKCLYSLDKVLATVDQTWVPHVARDLLQALAYIHRHGHVHKDVHPGNVFVSMSFDQMNPDTPAVAGFKLGDLGIARFEGDIRKFGTIMALWMTPPEAIDPERFGTVGRPTDIYHAALLLVGVMRREMYPFNQREIVSGVPQQMALSLHSPYREAIANALHPYVGRRTQTALEFWREIHSAHQYAFKSLEP
jgi:serine/threonine protein kinase